MTHTKEELQAIYFGFYDQLPEQIRRDAKLNWNYEFSKRFSVPETVDVAVSCGFDWGINGEWSKWNNFHTRILQNKILFNNTDLPPSEPTLSDIKNQLDRIEVLLNKLI